MKGMYRDSVGKLVFMLIVVFLILCYSLAQVSDSLKLDTVEECKIIDLQQQQLINRYDTDIRYIIITDKETFICDNSMFNSKFNNSDLFYRLKKDSTYNFRVTGYGKSWIFDYRNILEVVK